MKLRGKGRRDTNSQGNASVAKISAGKCDALHTAQAFSDYRLMGGQAVKNTSVMLESMYSTNYKTTCFGRQWQSSGFINQKHFKIVLYNLRNGVLTKRSRHQYFVYGYCLYIGCVGKSFEQYMKGNDHVVLNLDNK